MDNLLGQISSKLARGKDSAATPTGTGPIPGRLSLDQKVGNYTIAAARRGPSFSKSSPRDSCVEADYADAAVDRRSPRQPADDEEAAEVCNREDSETYAKRTITEIETCLGFSFPHASNEEDSETMDDAEIEKLSTHIEAALASGLSFKDRHRSPLQQHMATHAEGEEDGEDEGPDGSGAEEDSGEDAQSLSEDGDEDPVASTSSGDYTSHAKHGAAAAAGPGAAGAHRGQLGSQAKPKRGLQLRVGSTMEQGEWQSNGQWMKKDKSRDNSIPSNLQIIAPDDIVKVKELGRGCFGSVWLAKWRGVEVALKELLAQGTDTNPQEVFNEAEKLASLRHPCVMGFYGIVTSPECQGTVAEYICHGSLRSGLAKIKKKGIQDKRLKAYISLQGAHGMEYFHRKEMVHFDLKCDNLLCDLRDLNKPVVKIGDLGLSKNKKGSFISGNMRGTLPWMAPELFPSVPGAMSGMATRKDAEDRVTEKVDVFSYGICMWEIWTLGEQPYPNLSLQEIFAGVMTGTLRPAIPPGCDPAWASLMQDCWQGNPRLRPTFTEVIARLEAMLQRWSVPPAGTTAASHK